jgi:probable HAF family extracellular repeat protein
MFQQSFTRGLARITTAALAMACLSGSAQAAGYTLTLLGDLPGGNVASYACDINNVGQVVGQGHAKMVGNRAFLRDATNGMRDLGVLVAGGLYSTANGINEAGQVVGLSSVPGGNRAFLWDAVGGMQDLNDLIDPGLSAVLATASAINASG